MQRGSPLLQRAASCVADSGFTEPEDSRQHPHGSHQISAVAAIHPGPSTKSDCQGHPPQRSAKKPPPPRRRTPQGQPVMPPSPPVITEDPAYFVLDPEAEVHPPQSFGGQSFPPDVGANERQKSPEQENAENLDKEAHNSCQDLPCAPHLQQLDPTKGNSSWP